MARLPVVACCWFLARAIDVRDLDPWRFEKQLVERYVRDGNGTVYFVPAEPQLDGRVLCDVAVDSGARIPTDAFGRVDRRRDEDAQHCVPRHPERARSWHGLPEAAAYYAAHFRVGFLEIHTRLPAALAFTRFAFVGVVRDPLHAVAGGTEGDPARVKQYVNRQLGHYIGCAATIAQVFAKAGAAEATIRTGATRTLPHYRVGFEFRGGDERYVDVPDGDYAEQRARHRPNCAQAVLDFHRPTRDDLDAAKRRLDRFSVVAPLDRLAELAPLLKAKFGYGDVSALARFNYTAYSQPELAILAKVDGHIAAAFRRNTDLDRELYAYAGRLLDAQLQAHRNSWSGAVRVGRDASRGAGVEIGSLSSVKVHPAAERLEAPKWAALPDAFPMFEDAAREEGFGTALAV